MPCGCCSEEARAHDDPYACPAQGTTFVAHAICAEPSPSENRNEEKGRHQGEVKARDQGIGCLFKSTERDLALEVMCVQMTCDPEGAFIRSRYTQADSNHVVTGGINETSSKMICILSFSIGKTIF